MLQTSSMQYYDWEPTRCILKESKIERELEEKKITILKQKQVLSETKATKKTRKSLKETVQQHSGQCPIEYIGNIGRAMGQSDRLILLIGTLN